MKKLLVLVFMACTLVLAGAAASLAYENVSPGDAYAMVMANPHVYLLDVRTIAEWQWVGHPGVNKTGEGAALEGKVVNVSYEVQENGQMVLNNHFRKDVSRLFRDRSDVVLITMCRSGSRSAAAAALLEADGFSVLNLAAGFEGKTDANGYRTVNGWKVEGFPYTYAGEGYSHQCNHR